MKRIVISVLLLIFFSCEATVSNDNKDKQKVVGATFLNITAGSYFSQQMNVEVFFDTGIKDYSEFGAELYFDKKYTRQLYKRERNDSTYYYGSISLQQLADGKHTLYTSLYKNFFSEGETISVQYALDSIEIEVDNTPLNSVNISNVVFDEFGVPTITWEKSTSRSFKKYEIQRSSNSWGNYETIGVVTDININSLQVKNFSLPFGSSTYFRIKVYNNFNSATGNYFRVRNYGQKLAYNITGEYVYNSTKNEYYVYENNVVKIVSADGNIKAITQNFGTVTGFQLSSDNTKLYIGTHSSLIVLNTSDYSTTTVDLSNHSSSFYSIRIIRDKIYAATSYRLYMIQLSDQKLLSTASINYSYSGFQITEGSSSEEIVLIPKSNTYLYTFKTSNNILEKIKTVNFNSYSNWAYRESTKTLYVVNNYQLYKTDIGSLNTFTAVNGIGFSSSSIYDIKVTDKYVLVSLYENGNKVNLYNLADGTLKQSWAFGNNITNVTFNPDQTFVYAYDGSATYAVKIK